MIFKNVKKSWMDFFVSLNLKERIEEVSKIAYSEDEVYPPKELLLNIFSKIEIEDVKVVIIGQDPYHNPGQADGIAFSVANNIKTPPSLKNIFKELKNDLNVDHFENNSLVGWVEQGVLLINTVFTVPKNRPNAHQKIGWTEIVIEILNHLIEKNDDLIFCLWGNNAKNLYNKLVDNKNDVVHSTHPSPFSYRNGFENSRPFSNINRLLNIKGYKEIDWKL